MEQDSNPKTILINQVLVTSQPGESILQTALRMGIAMPHSCRVGGCGTCKCRLEKGEVRQLTETAYLLSKAEIDAGFILACQSQLLSDAQISFSVDQETPRYPPKKVEGRIQSVESVTDDISLIKVNLVEPLPYRAGQHALLSMQNIAGPRNYSFASMPSKDNQAASFYVRKVPGGQFSNYICSDAALGQTITLEGPFGDFWLRPSHDPLLLIAGGSGLAPILSILENALQEEVCRPVTLLFGARQTKDLYALDRISLIKTRWKDRFSFVPVLSAEKVDSPWKGERGIVASKIRDLCEPAVHAYLCGPPAMIDSCIAELSDLDVPNSRIYTDRFTTSFDALPKHAPTKPIQYAGVWHYCKYFGMHLSALGCTVMMARGEVFITWGLLIFISFYTLGDAISGDDKTTPKYRYPEILRWQLWAALPLLLLFLFVFVWQIAPQDMFGFGSWLQQLTNLDILSGKAATNIWHLGSAVILAGLMIALLGTITAHELTHRTWDRISLNIGRWLLAFSFDTIFAIEHVYGHHRYVGSSIDPASAPRGRNVYAHIWHSTIKGNISAWHIETERLAKKNLWLFSWHNAVLRGYAMSLFIVLLVYLAAGPQATLLFILAGSWGKALLEIVNYMEHYGIVRDLRTPVDPRHSWNTNKRLSSWSSFNLTRHSHHHAQGEVPFQKLRPYPKAPEMISGYLATIVLALIPPIWHRLMIPKLLDWDDNYASPGEKLLAKAANAQSGLPALIKKAGRG